MNSFAALIGALTGVPVAGAAGVTGVGLTASSETGLFAGLLEAGATAQPVAEGETAQTLQAALLAGDGASGLGTITLTSQIDALVELDDALVELDGVQAAPASEVLPEDEEQTANVPVAAELTADGEAVPAPDEATDGAETDGAVESREGNKKKTDTDTGSSAAADANVVLDAAVGTPAAGNTAAPSLAANAGQDVSGHDTAPGQQQAAAHRPENAQLRATTAPGLTRQPPPAQPSQSNTGGTPAPAGPGASAPQPANAAPDTSSGDETGNAAAKLPETPRKSENRSRAYLAKPAELIRTIAGPAGAQVQLRLVKPGDSDIKAVGGIDQTAGTIQLRAAPALAQPAGQLPQIPVNSLAVHIAQQANNGARRFDIRLDPPELGRVEVRLDVSRDGHVTTHLVVERSETLDLLQRDARALERALQNAGLNTPDGGMKFSLKDHGQGQGQAMSRDAEQNSSGAFPGAMAGETSLESDNIIHNERRYLATGGLDIRI